MNDRTQKESPLPEKRRKKIGAALTAATATLISGCSQLFQPREEEGFVPPLPDSGLKVPAEDAPPERPKIEHTVPALEESYADAARRDSEKDGGRKI